MLQARPPEPAPEPVPAVVAWASWDSLSSLAVSVAWTAGARGEGRFRGTGCGIALLCATALCAAGFARRGGEGAGGAGGAGWGGASIREMATGSVPDGAGGWA